MGCWKMSVLQMPVPTGNREYWKMLVIENADTTEIIVGYENCCRQHMVACRADNIKL